jgi:hypothetical protein
MTDRTERPRLAPGMSIPFTSILARSWISFLQDIDIGWLFLNGPVWHAVCIAV